MTPFAFIVASLAIWRLSHGIVKEDGPLMMWARLRARLARTQRHSGGLFDMVSCVRCISFWISLVGALIVSNSFLGLFAYAFALSASASLIDKLYSLNFVTTPTRDDQVLISRRSTPKQRFDVICDPDTFDRQSTIEATTLLGDCVLITSPPFKSGGFLFAFKSITFFL